MIRSLTILVLFLFPVMTSAIQQEIIPEQQKWSFSGITGYYDKEQLRRGLQIHEAKCRACHSIKYLSFKSLTLPGGPELTRTEAEAIAKSYQYSVVQDDGQITERDGTLYDTFVSPYLNEQEASYLNNGSYPIDLSYIVRARSYNRGFPQFLLDAFLPYTEQGADYIFSLLTGYLTNNPGMNENRYYPGQKINMPKPLADGDIHWKSSINIPETEEQYARDVTAFLAWVADPNLAERKKQGCYVLGYLSIMLCLSLALLKTK